MADDKQQQEQQAPNPVEAAQANNPDAPVDPVPAPDNPDDLPAVPGQGQFTAEARGGKEADYEAAEAPEGTSSGEEQPKRSSKKG